MLKHALILGAGASLAAPAGRPSFLAIRQALADRLDVDLGDDGWRARMAPEALLSRLVAAGVDVERELRAMLSGGEPNALHFIAAEVLRRGGAVWTTNFDELVEDAAEAHGIELHLLLPGDDVACQCGHGHLVKPHGTLSRPGVLARSEDVLRPLPDSWTARLLNDLDGARAAVVGYAGADVDLRTGLGEALRHADAIWFGRPSEAALLRRRFPEVIVEPGDRPDIMTWEWAQGEGLAGRVSAELVDQLRQPVRGSELRATFSTDRLLRAHILDAFGHAVEARRAFRAAMVAGPRRREALADWFSSGLIHGTPWRPVALAALNTACALPVRWRVLHVLRLPYLTFNVEAAPRLRTLERSLERLGKDGRLVLEAANAAKEVRPERAIELAQRAREHALDCEQPARVAWATFILSFALRWRGDVDAARVEASRLVDAYGPLAGPTWTAWGHFEAAAVAALSDDLAEATDQAMEAVDVFAAAGSMFVFDAWCVAIAVHRAAGDDAARAAAGDEARRLLGESRLRRRFMREVLLVEDAESAREQGRLESAERAYTELSESPTVAQRVLGMLGIGEVQRARHECPEASWSALRLSDELSFGFGQVHACVTLGLAGAMAEDEAERRIGASLFQAPQRDDVRGLLRFCQGQDPELHLLCFP